jgi:hypothetical protein
MNRRVSIEISRSVDSYVLSVVLGGMFAVVQLQLGVTLPMRTGCSYGLLIVIFAFTSAPRATTPKSWFVSLSILSAQSGPVPAANVGD